jgi:hypothetical protein
VQFRRAHASDSAAILAFLSKPSPTKVQARFLSPANYMSEQWSNGEVRQVLDVAAQCTVSRRCGRWNGLAGRRIFSLEDLGVLVQDLS